MPGSRIVAQHGCYHWKLGLRHQRDGLDEGLPLTFRAGVAGAARPDQRYARSNLLVGQAPMPALTRESMAARSARIPCCRSVDRRNWTTPNANPATRRTTNATIGHCAGEGGSG
jgi:hypothetical protein